MPLETDDSSKLPSPSLFCPHPEPSGVDLPLPEALLAGKDLGCRVGDRWLWRGVSFALRRGDCMGLVAPSGAGKTLLLRQLVGLDPLPMGQVMFGGRSLADWNLPVYRTQVMYLPQRAIAFEGTVADNLKRAFSLAVHRSQRYDPTPILQWLQQLGRDSHFLTLQGHQLSGGEMQLLALLRALQLHPTVLLLDEPTASLDPATTTQVEALLTNWLRSPHRACLLISHDPDQIHRFTNCQLNLGELS